jgi:hypothetical protein
MYTITGKETGIENTDLHKESIKERIINFVEDYIITPAEDHYDAAVTIPSNILLVSTDIPDVHADDMDIEPDGSDTNLETEPGRSVRHHETFVDDSFTCLLCKTQLKFENPVEHAISKHPEIFSYLPENLSDNEFSNLQLFIKESIRRVMKCEQYDNVEITRNPVKKSSVEIEVSEIPEHDEDFTSTTYYCRLCSEISYDFTDPILHVVLHHPEVFAKGPIGILKIPKITEQIRKHIDEAHSLCSENPEMQQHIDTIKAYLASMENKEENTQPPLQSLNKTMDFLQTKNHGSQPETKQELLHRDNHLVFPPANRDLQLPDVLEFLARYHNH